MSLNISQINYHSPSAHSKAANSMKTSAVNNVSFGVGIDWALLAVETGVTVGLLSLFGTVSSKMSKKSSYLLDSLGFIKAKAASLQSDQGKQLLQKEYEYAEKYLLEKHKRVLNPYGFLTQTFYAVPRDVYTLSKNKIENFTQHLKRIGFEDVSQELKAYLTHVQQVFDQEALTRQVSKRSKT